MTRFQEHNYKLRLIAVIQECLHCNKAYWSTHSLLTKPLADLKKVLRGFSPMIKTVDIDSILMVLFTEESGDVVGQDNKKGLFKIEDSPHYKFLMGNTHPYIQYYRKYLAQSRIERNKKIHSAMYTRSTDVEDGLFAQEMVSPDNYIQFMSKFNYLDKLNSDKHIKVIPFKRGYYLTNNGDHRLAILKYQKIKNITVSIKRG